jgi:signal transduction histidine kinase
LTVVNDGQGWPPSGPTPAQQRNDIALAAAVAAGAVVTTVLVNSIGAFPFGTAPGLAEQIAWSVALTTPLALRRRFPATVVLVVAAFFVAAQARHLADHLIPSIALFLALYSLGAWAADRALARWVRIGVILAMFGWLGLSMSQQLAGPPFTFDTAAGPLDPLLALALYSIGFNLLFFLAAYFFGNVAWQARRHRHELQVQGEQLRCSQAENARQAVVAERLRIARDLHDVVAHHVSVMGVQAAAARRVLDSDPGQARESLSAVEQTARTAIGELRDLVGVLRAGPEGAAAEPEGTTAADGAATTPAEHRSAPGLGQVPDLVADFRASSGLAIGCAIFGDPRPVPDAVALSAYRVVQEALTNIVKHAAARHAEVRIRYLDHSLELEISDDGRPTGPPLAATPASSGLGLVGMRERVAVHGGELETGPRRTGGFLVRARLPLPAAEAADRDEAAEAAGGGNVAVTGPAVAR